MSKNPDCWHTEPCDCPPAMIKVDTSKLMQVEPAIHHNAVSMRRFFLHRGEDETGVSGTGVIVEGVEFSNGQVVLRWLTAHSSIAVFDSIEEVKAVHGHGGKTWVVYIDEDDSVKTFQATLDALRKLT